MLFSLTTALVVFIVLEVVFSGIQLFTSYNDLGELNRETFATVTCQETCNIDEYVEDWSIVGADYILKKDGLFLIHSHFENFYIEFSNPGFLDNFKQPTKWASPIEGEVWTLYATEKNINGKKAKIMVGWIEETPGIIAKTPGSDKVNEALIQETEKIASQLSIKNGRIISESIKSKVDGFQIVDANTGRVIDWGGSIPAFLPENIRNGFPLYVDKDKNIFLVRDEEKGNVRAISLDIFANLWWYTFTSFLTITIIFSLAYVAGSTLFKKWLLLYRRNLPSTIEVLNKGEGQEIEFKRGIVDDEILKSITAFANTNDGIIVLGVDDKSRIVGVNVSSAKDKERLIHKLFNLLRSRIRPSLNIRIDFEYLKGLEIAKIFVPRGDEPLYYLDSIIYVRHGDSDIKSSPELIKKILREFTI